MGNMMLGNDEVFDIGARCRALTLLDKLQFFKKSFT